MNSNSITIPRKNIKDTAYYIALRAIVCLAFALLIIFVASLVFLPQKASADTTSTYYIPVAGLGYYVDAQGKPINSGTQVQYSCTNTVCLPTQSTSNQTAQSGQSGQPWQQGQSARPTQQNQNTGNGNNPYASSYSYPKYLTPVASTQGAYPSNNSGYGNNSGFASYPTPSYSTPIASYSNGGVNGVTTPSGDKYYSYPTYGSTPVYGKISAGPANNTGSSFGSGTNGANSTSGTTPAYNQTNNSSNPNRGFQLTSGLGNNLGSGYGNTGPSQGGFVMTSSGY